MNLVNYNYNENLEPIINFETAVRMRTKAILLLGSSQELPLYLLAPEVNKLIDCVDDLKISFLIKTLWITGARISAILKIKENDFKYIKDKIIDKDGNLKSDESWYLSIKRLKFGRPSKKIKDNEEPTQLIKIYDNRYINALKIYTSTYNIKPHQPLFNITRQTAYNWIQAAVKMAEQKGITFPIHIDTYTFRHSHAMHMLFHGLSKKDVQTRLGHKNAENTEIYTKLFEIDNDKKINFF